MDILHVEDIFEGLKNCQIMEVSDWMRRGNKAGDSYSGLHSSWSSAPADGNVMKDFPDGSANPSSLALGSLQIQWTSAHTKHKEQIKYCMIHLFF